MGKRPLDVLHAALNQRVAVELRGGRAYRGTLDGYDHPHLNLVLRDAEELLAEGPARRYTNLIVRGDTIVSIVP